MDNGFIIIVIIAILSTAADWIGKRRKARQGRDSGSPLRPQASPSGEQARAGDPRSSQRSEDASPSSLFDHLQAELRKMTEQDPLVEVLDKVSEDSTHSTRDVSLPPEKIAPKMEPADGILAQQGRFSEIENRKREAARELAELREKLRRPKRSSQPNGDAFMGGGNQGIDAGNLRRWLKHPGRLRQAIALNTLLEKPTGIKMLKRDFFPLKRGS
jgi:hypothetical protein